MVRRRDVAARSQPLADGSGAVEALAGIGIRSRDEQRETGKAIAIALLPSVNLPWCQILWLHRVVMQGQEEGGVGRCRRGGPIRELFDIAMLADQTRAKAAVAQHALDDQREPAIEGNSGSPRALMAPGRD